MKTKKAANDLRAGGLIICLLAAELLGLLTGWIVGPVVIAVGVILVGLVVAWLAVTAGMFYTIGQMGAIEQIGYDNEELDPR